MTWLDTSRERSGGRTFAWAVAIGVAAAGVFCYANALRGGFVWDDASSVLLHRTVQDPSRFFELFGEDQHAYGRGEGNFYRPLLAATFMLDYALAAPGEGAAPNPAVFHMTSMLWHVAAALLLFVLLRRLDAPRFVQAAAPVLYVVHPLHTEAVAYISGRADPMAAALIYGALAAALWDRRRLAGAALSGLLFVAALLSKESAAIYPVLLFAVVLAAPATPGGTLRRRIAARWPALGLAVVLAVVYGALRATVLRFGDPGATLVKPLGARLVETGQAFAVYLRLIFWPTGLHMERTLDGVPGWMAAAGYGLMAAMLALLAVCVVKGWRRPGLGLAWFFVTWFPISGLIPLNAPLAEHWMYVPLAGFLLALLEALWAALDRPRGRLVAVAAVWLAATGLAMGTAARNLDWLSNEALFRATLAESPGSTRVHYNLAVTYEDLLDNPAGARRHYARVIALYEERKEASGEQDRYWPDELESHLSLGGLYLEQGAVDLAARHFGAVLQSGTGDVALAGPAVMGMARCMLARGDAGGAERLLDQAAEAFPELAPQAEALLGPMRRAAAAP